MKKAGSDCRRQNQQLKHNCYSCCCLPSFASLNLKLHIHSFSLRPVPLPSLLHCWVQGWRGAAVWACHVWDIPDPAKRKRGQGRGGRTREFLNPRKNKPKKKSDMQPRQAYNGPCLNAWKTAGVQRRKLRQNG